MPYQAEISRVNPSCFLFLIDRSDSMRDAMAGGNGKKKCDAVADAINKLLQNLVIKCAKSEGIRDYYEVGVIGYGDQVGPAFSGPLAGRELAKISEVAQSPLQVEERTKKVPDGAGGLVEQTVKFPVWFQPVHANGTPMCAALHFAREVLQRWTASHAGSYPPIVINITDGECNDGDPTGPAAGLTGLATSDGNLLLFNCHISSKEGGTVTFAHAEAGLVDEHALQLFRMSSVLPGPIRDTARAEGLAVQEGARGFAFNAELVDLIRFLDIGTKGSNLR